eukprot:NODE_1771_length_1613_cov_307.518121_g1685_i0.p1 GENE.NODE_1771_length_1613_cov_307.518121_g1685_i0~~NODE_1771_length_1613_cov_307.518121_g1685_i0.p1  ORF type:complete len:480 (-),score=153.38 NODE_1771_length_1613_cov_307.518121_g1685_i0:174-1556(-)
MVFCCAKKESAAQKRARQLEMEVGGSMMSLCNSGRCNCATLSGSAFSTASQWDPVAHTDSKATVDSMFAKSGVFRRDCPNCIETHKTIYYKRLTPIPAGFSIFDNMFKTWSSVNNKLHVDFQLYSSEADMKANTNAWTCCNFDDPGVAFPRDCGSTACVGGQWNSIDPRHVSNKTTSYFVMRAQPPAPDAVSVEATMFKGKEAVDTLFNQTGVFRRDCPSCIASHRTIFYKRKTPIPAGFSIYDNMFTTWSSVNNAFHVDFELYSSEADMNAGRNAWTCCNFNDPGVAFPRDCGSTGCVGHQWNSVDPRHTSGKKDTSFHVMMAYTAPGVTTTAAPTTAAPAPATTLGVYALKVQSCQSEVCTDYGKLVEQLRVDSEDLKAKQKAHEADAAEAEKQRTQYDSRAGEAQLLSGSHQAKVAETVALITKLAAQRDAAQANYLSTKAKYDDIVAKATNLKCPN